MRPRGARGSGVPGLVYVVSEPGASSPSRRSRGWTCSRGLRLFWSRGGCLCTCGRGERPGTPRHPNPALQRGGRGGSMWPRGGAWPRGPGPCPWPRGNVILPGLFDPDRGHCIGNLDPKEPGLSRSKYSGISSGRRKRQADGQTGGKRERLKTLWPRPIPSLSNGDHPELGVGAVVEPPVRGSLRCHTDARKLGSKIQDLINEEENWGAKGHVGFPGPDARSCTFY